MGWGNGSGKKEVINASVGDPVVCGSDWEHPFAGKLVFIDVSGLAHKASKKDARMVVREGTSEKQLDYMRKQLGSVAAEGGTPVLILDGRGYPPKLATRTVRREAAAAARLEAEALERAGCAAAELQDALAVLTAAALVCVSVRKVRPQSCSRSRLGSSEERLLRRSMSSRCNHSHLDPSNPSPERLKGRRCVGPASGGDRAARLESRMEACACVLLPRCAVRRRRSCRLCSNVQFEALGPCRRPRGQLVTSAEPTVASVGGGATFGEG